MISKILKTDNSKLNEENKYVGAYAPAKTGDVSKAVEKIGQFDKFGSVLGLERVSELLKRLGNPQKDLKFIHIAGTNGKGSVSRFVYSVLRESGYSVGIYSSPYLEVFNERIEADGQYITDEKLEEYADQASKIAREMCDEGLLSPTEFDVVTAIAFMYFKERNVDYVVLEVGLGGRGDSTNVIENPMVTAITSISYDHMDRLGNTLAEIAGEKAGIIKKAPVVVGPMDPSASKVIIEKATVQKAEIYQIHREDYTIVDESLKGSTFTCKILDKTWENLKIQMLGEHQIQNAMVALSCLQLMNINLNDADVRRGMFLAKNPGRLEIMQENPYVILDGAHNPAGVEGLVKTLKENFGQEKLLIIIGILKDKAVTEMCAGFKDLNADFITTEPNNPRKMPKEELGKIMENMGLSVVGTILSGQAKEVTDKFTACTENKYNGIIFVGSLYLIGEVRRLMHDS